MNLIYSCVFFNSDYIKLINLLMKSFVLFGCPKKNYDYLIICDPSFKDQIKNIFVALDLNGQIWCLDLTSKFESAYSRLRIFEYPKIANYSLILYLDCDILVTNKLSHIFNLNLEEKLYVLQETCHNLIIVIFLTMKSILI